MRVRPYISIDTALKKKLHCFECQVILSSNVHKIICRTSFQAQRGLKEKKLRWTFLPWELVLCCPSMELCFLRVAAPCQAAFGQRNGAGRRISAPSSGEADELMWHAFEADTPYLHMPVVLVKKSAKYNCSEYLSFVFMMTSCRKARIDFQCQ